MQKESIDKQSMPIVGKRKKFASGPTGYERRVYF